MSAGIRLTDHHGGMLENLTNRFRVALRIGMNKTGFELFFEGYIQDQSKLSFPSACAISCTVLRSKILFLASFTR
jgi:hypothetical protein